MKRPAMKQRGPLTLILSLGLLSPALAGQQEPQAIVSETVEVRVVNVEVVVTDRKGTRVTGLAAESFRLTVDGEEVPIAFFSEIVDGEVIGGAADTSLPGSLETGKKVGTNYLVFVDDQFSIARDRNRVIDKLAEDLGDLGAADQMAIVAYDGSQLAKLAVWTSDKPKILGAFEEAKKRRTGGLDRLGELRENDSEKTFRQAQLEEVEDQVRRATTGPGGISQLEGEEELKGQFQVLEDPMWGRLNPVEYNYARRLEEQLKRSVAAAVASLRSLTAPPGRKVMLILAGGWTFSPAEFAVASYDAVEEFAVGASMDRAVSRGRKLYGPLADTANLLGYTLYPVDVPGVRRETLDASTPSEGALRGSGDRGIEDNSEQEVITSPLLSPGGNAAREQSSHDSLRFLASQTGGAVMLNSARDVAFAEAVADTRTYYWLGFNNNPKGDDVAHRIEVDILTPGLEARSRRGFLDLSSAAEAEMIVESALYFDDPFALPALQLTFGEPAKAGRGKVMVPLEVGIPMDKVEMLFYHGRLVADLQVLITVMDENGTRSDTKRASIHIEANRRAAPGAMHTWQTELLMRRRKHRIVVAVSDPIHGGILTTSTDLEP